MAKKSSGNWIQKAIKNPGSLRKTAKSAAKINKEGKIDRSWLDKEAKKSGKTGKRARSAITLRKLH